MPTKQSKPQNDRKREEESIRGHEPTRSRLIDASHVSTTQSSEAFYNSLVQDKLISYRSTKVTFNRLFWGSVLCVSISISVLIFTGWFVDYSNDKYSIALVASVNVVILTTSLYTVLLTVYTLRLYQAQKKAYLIRTQTDLIARNSDLLLEIEIETSNRLHRLQSERGL